MNSLPTALYPELLTQLQSQKPFLWINQAYGAPLPADVPTLEAVAEARDRLQRSTALMVKLFPELAATQGRIESDLIAVPQLQAALLGEGPSNAAEQWFIKADHALPIAGSVKARGGFHEIIALAESIALENNLISANDDLIKLANSDIQGLLSQYTVTVGSTGNLGLSIGIMAAALGFTTIVHMSVDAKEWKKTRLRARGVKVIEHSGDYAAAVAAGRAEALATPKCHFIDDEQSLLLFLGYAASAPYVAQQLLDANRVVDAEHPLFVYIPCGVGGAPGGITYGLKALFGEHVHCFFAEPVASPCMLVQLASQQDAPVSVYDIGLDNRTEADGLAVALASHLVSPIMRSQLSGVFTVSNDALYGSLYQVKLSEGITLEPSAAAGIPGPGLLQNSEAGRRYLQHHKINLSGATHMIWSTGGSLVPAEEYARFEQQGKAIHDTLQGK